MDNAVQVGILGCPKLCSPAYPEPGCILFACKGQGSFQIELDGDLNGKKPISVQQVSSWKDLTVVQSVESHSRHDLHEKIAARIGISHFEKIDSQCKYAMVALGLAGVYIRLASNESYKEKIWDHAAGSLIVQEAGGIVSDALNAPFNWTLGSSLAQNTGIIASCNPELHKQITDSVPLYYPSNK